MANRETRRLLAEKQAKAPARASRTCRCCGVEGPRHLRHVPRPSCHPNARVWIVEHRNGTLGLECGICHRDLARFEHSASLQDAGGPARYTSTEVTPADLSREAMREARNEAERRRLLREQQAIYRQAIKAEGDALDALGAAANTVSQKHNELLDLVRRGQ